MFGRYVVLFALFSAQNTYRVFSFMFFIFNIFYVSFVKKSPSALKKFVFVTAASDNHFGEAIVSIYNIRKHFPDKQVYFYDLGLSESRIEQVNILFMFFVLHGGIYES